MGKFACIQKYREMAIEKRGIMYWVNLDPTLGTEITNKTRSALIV
jgi:hypothetical protein